ncbi:hypothetical protein [Candidatus Pantoea floridensis]|uniref:Uncharacterized protein n=1 Tax=Candidatus Pantoea floridensis TaxID=1938870 RepID=A0A286BT92_9GAMM|nr:hypothetical protein [Pantoea floridensis]PIF23907.1 hypothetical protein BX596_3388 [Enterobacteriaceae bacterium JKS000233]SOD37359.1 hypothetical protein SAMN06273570_1709 [Pantoea floridensis]
MEALTASVTGLLVEGRAFDISGIILRVDDRAVKFEPVFLYGQVVKGCVEATFHDGGHVTSLGRLFMQSGSVSEWTFTPTGALSRPGKIIDESTFFGLILELLP